MYIVTCGHIIFVRTLTTLASGLPFASRADLERGARLLKQHLARFGLGSMHADGSIAKIQEV